ncbi:MAG: efflux RND transporter periplasmic adaptor subunit [Variovorax sp.]|nr:MAG: efflux RND transporter periplasmic adaptor subunit [Variovorax sp.]
MTTSVFPSAGFAAIALAAALMLAGCGAHDAPAANPEPPAPIVQGNQIRFVPDHPQLKLLAVVPATAAKSVSVDLPGRLVWNEERTQRVFAPFAGRVTDIKADVGQSVKAGDLLAQLASPDFGIAQADTAKAQADASFSRKNLERQRELFQAGIIARKDLEQAEADSARSQAEASRAGARTTMYGGGMGVNQRFGIRSGINGVVVERNLNPGQELRPDQSGPGTQALFVVTDPTSLWVQIDAKENDIGSLQKGANFTVQVPAYPGESFTGRVTAASDFIDPTTRTIKIRGVIANADRRLKGEMLVTALVDEALTGTVVPARAVTLDGNNQTVYVQTQPGVFEPRRVKIGHTGTREVVIASGLAVGEQVVADNALLLARQFAVAREDARPATPAGGTAPAAASTAAPAASGTTKP